MKVQACYFKLTEKHHEACFDVGEIWGLAFYYDLKNKEMFFKYDDGEILKKYSCPTLENATEIILKEHSHMKDHLFWVIEDDVEE